MCIRDRLSRDDVKYFRRICEPRLTIERICVEGQMLAFKLRMEANEIAFIEIHKEM